MRPIISTKLKIFLIIFYNSIFYKNFAEKIDLTALFQQWGFTTVQSTDTILRGLWKSEKTSVFLRNYKSRELEQIENLLNSNDMELEELIEQIEIQKENGVIRVGELLEQKVAQNENARDIEALWTQFFIQLRDKYTHLNGQILFNNSESQERWIPFGSLTLALDVEINQGQELLELVGEFPRNGNWTGLKLEMYIRANRVCYPLAYEASEHDDLTKEFLSNPSQIQTSRELSLNQSATQSFSRVGIVQKDLLLLLHPAMANYRWSDGSFYKVNSSPHLTKLVEGARKILRGQKFDTRREELVEQIMVLTPGQKLNNDDSVAVSKAIEEAALDAMDLIKARHGLRRLYYENILLKTDRSVLTKLIRIIHPIFEDYTLEILEEIYRKQSVPLSQWVHLRQELEKILLNRQKALGKN